LLFRRKFKSRKAFSFRGASPPDPPPRALPLHPAGGSVSRPPDRLALHALAITPPPGFRIFSPDAAERRGVATGPVGPVSTGPLFGQSEIFSFAKVKVVTIDYKTRA